MDNFAFPLKDSFPFLYVVPPSNFLSASVSLSILNPIFILVLLLDEIISLAKFGLIVKCFSILWQTNHTGEEKESKPEEGSI